MTDDTPSLQATEVIEVPVEELHLDPRNPRILEAGTGDDENSILHLLWREFAVEEVALSIAANGYFRYEPLLVDSSLGQNVVVEGNRRLAAVRLLRDRGLRKQVGATDLPRATRQVLAGIQTLPVVFDSRDEFWRFVGFKHVNGPQAWGSYAKAEYIAWVRNSLGRELDEIAATIGDTHLTVRRLYRAFMALEEAETAGVYSRDNRSRKHFSFSHLYTGLNYSGIASFVGIRADGGSTKRPIRKNRLKNFGELCGWLWGDTTRSIESQIRSQNPDLRILDEVLQTDRGLDALRSGLPLKTAREIGRGDDRVFREALVAAKQALQQARGKVLTGYKGEPDLFSHAEDISQLSDVILEDMRDVRGSRRKRSANP